MSLTFSIYLLTILVSALIGILNYQKLSKYFQILVQIIVIVFFSEIIGRILAIRINTSFPTYHFLLIFQFLYFNLLFMRIFGFSRKFISLLTISVIYVFAGIFNYLSYRSINFFPSTGITLFSLFMVVGTLFLLFKILSTPEQGSLFKSSFFWFAIGNLQFHAITIFVFGLYDVILKAKSNEPEWFYDLIWFSNLILYISDGIALHLDAHRYNARSEAR